MRVFHLHWQFPPAAGDPGHGSPDWPSPARGGGDFDSFLPFSASIARAAQKYFDSARLKNPELRDRINDVMGEVRPKGLRLRDQRDERLEPWKRSGA